MLLAFPHIYIDSHGNNEYRDGALFSLPPELYDKFRQSRYLEIKGIGWQKTEYGYLAYIQNDDLGNKYILPGLYVSDGPQPTKRFHGYKPNFTKAQVEGYLRQHIEWEGSVRKKSELELTALVHDLRHLSSSIYHSAIEAEKGIIASDRTKSLEDIKTVIASQTMLKVRIDYLDFANSVDRFVDQENIPVYSRVDKVIRCFRASARHKGIDIYLRGESYRLARGPNILDIIPYTIIENAIKYAPEKTEIIVNVSDIDAWTHVSVSSIGPTLGEREHKEIFRRGYRSANAIKFRGSGTGLGLAVASSVVDVFRGSLSVSQDVMDRTIHNIEFAPIHFHFAIPTSGEDVRRKARFRTRSNGAGRRTIGGAGR